ncbi:CatB-related O-acetyltransferase [Mucilaginibacter sp.]|uniref:CatB-related O-acetyltransferase n=1 Tax=Mucilaginibacter sp. TaxID=1882438 RepID=UPI003D11FE77
MIYIFKKIINKFFKKKKVELNAPAKELNYIIDKSSVGKFCKIGKDCYLFNTIVGDYSYLSKNVSFMNCSIGKFCSIAQGVSASLGMHPSSVFVSTHPSFFSLSKQNGMTFSDKNYFEEMGNTIIGHDVWIGVNAIIMDNITIHNGAIIGAGAIVTKDIPAYAIVVGAPAQVIKYRFEKSEIEFLEKFKWWDKDEEWLKANYKDLHDIKLFIAKYSNDPH